MAAVLGVLIAVALLFAPSLSTWSPFLVWNASPSVPVGLYWIDQTPPRVGDLVLVRLTGPMAGLANRRGYLSRTVYLLKPVFAVAGDRVCRFGIHIFVRRRLAALARGNDSAGRPMPSWHGCRTLQAGELFVLAGDPASFDSRYFGRLRTEHVAGRAAPSYSRLILIYRAAYRWPMHAPDAPHPMAQDKQLPAIAPKAETARDDA